MTDTAIVIVNYNTEAFLGTCLRSVLTHVGASDTEIIVVDNASPDGSCDMVRSQFPTVTLLAQQTNLGFGGGNNCGVESSMARNIVLLNSDVVLTSDTPHALCQYLDAHPDVACVAPRVVLPNGAIQPKVFGNLPSLWRVTMQSFGINRALPRSRFFAGVDVEHRNAREIDVGWVSGVCMAVRREQYTSAGGFDRRFFMYCEDIDLCRRLGRRGRIVLLDEHPVIHYGGASTKTASNRIINAVWQQRNLLQIVSGMSGTFVTWMARAVIVPGLLLRLLVGLALIPARGIRRNFLLCAAAARLLDVLGFVRLFPIDRR
ncbi:MAG: glycosyltransferase family 2 protein [Rhizomicrobium sp.]